MSHEVDAPFAVAATYPVPTGSASVSVAEVATSGPLFLTWKV
jgi:hypothetical protein